jgi:WD40 repeat protein
VTRNGRWAITAADGPDLTLWNLNDLQTRVELSGHTAKVTAVVALADGRALSGAEDGTIHVWELARAASVAMLIGHRDRINGLDVARDGKLAVSVSEDATIRVWDLIRHQEIASFTGDGPILSCALRSDGGVVVAGERSGQVHLLRLVGM